MRARQVAAVMCWTVVLGGCASGTWEPATVPEESLMAPPPIPGEATPEENAFFEDEPAEAEPAEETTPPEPQAPEKQEPENKALDKKAADKKAADKKAAEPNESKPAKAAADAN